MAYRHILDNRTHTVADYLRSNLQGGSVFRLVSAYFSIYGFEQLEDALNSVTKVRFLYGDPTSVDEVDPGEAEPKSFEVTERGLSPRHTLNQKFLAQRCAEWVGSDTVSIRSIALANFLHGKLYLTSPPVRSIVGSSNFTQRGLGASSRSNIEINLASSDPEIYAELQDWFDRIWRDEKLTADAKQQVLDALARIGKEHAPELIYFKTLYELFRDDIDARIAQQGRGEAAGLGDTAIWKTLYQFQKDGALSAIAKLQRHNGCILADSVGLGKTYTALAVIKHFELCNERVLVLCPRKLRANWSLYLDHIGHTRNPFPDDRFAYTLLSHTDLSRYSGEVGYINLANFNWQNYALIVIDESHNFRNHEGKRYERLLNEAIGKGVKTKVLMLSATPVNTSLIDLRNQIYLMTENREDSFRESLNVSNVGNLLKRAQDQFREWESQAPSNGQRNKKKLLDSLGSDFYRLLGGISIARSRRQIEEFYAAEIDRIGRFPVREKPVNVYPPTDLEGGLSYKELAERISAFTLSIYRPSDYVVSERGLQKLAEEKKAHNFNQADREQFLIAMIRTNFLKRLESSAYSLTLTLDRTIGKIDALLEKIDRYESRRITEDTQADTLPDDDEDDEEFLINRARHPYNLADLDLRAWKKDLRQDRKTLSAAHASVAQITPQRDGKLARIREQIKDRDANPTTDRKGRENRKLLVFTTFKDTAEYLYDNLQDLTGELNLKMAMVSGDATLPKAGPNNFNRILDNFAPAARGRGESNAGNDIDLLIATDCISEGQNLQDCDTVLNYDIHWNPIRIVQRFGRIDRIGSQSDSVRMINYWPTEAMEAYLRLQTRVEARMALADAAASGDENPLDNYEGIQGELNFRAQQLQQLLDENLDLDDLTADGVTMSDFTLDQFFTQLLHYLGKNREELEQTALGAYAVVDREKDTGVIWVLRQRNASQDRQTQVASPVHPFYIVHVRDDGKIRHGCASVKQTLDLFQELSLGKTEAVHKLCDEFNRRTENGAKMVAYDSLLNAAAEHISQAHSKTQTAGLGLQGSGDFRLSRSSETPDDVEAFELITWLVMLPREQD